MIGPVVLAALAMAAADPPAGATAPWQGNGRIAISSDGNEHDHDDWAATPLSLALLAARGLQDRLALYTFSDHVWGSNRDFKNAREQMRVGALGGAEQFGFDRARFVEAVADPEAAYAAVARVIDASTADDPLFLVAAGPMQVVGEGLKRSDPARRKFVTVISHSRWNDEHADDPGRGERHGGWTWDEMKAAFAKDGVTFRHIADQNGGPGYQGMKAPTARYDWLKTSPSRDRPPYRAGSWDWLHERQRQCIKDGDFDPSDAGMIVYLLTGKEKTDPDDARAILENPTGR
jgi:hypothetical protein